MGAALNRPRFRRGERSSASALLASAFRFTGTLCARFFCVISFFAPSEAPREVWAGGRFRKMYLRSKMRGSVTPGAVPMNVSFQMRDLMGVKQPGMWAAHALAVNAPIRYDTP